MYKMYKKTKVPENSPSVFLDSWALDLGTSDHIFGNIISPHLVMIILAKGSKIVAKVMVGFALLNNELKHACWATVFIL